MLTPKIISYFVLIISLLTLSLIFLYLSSYRLIIAVIIGLSYFIWGLITHWLDKNLHWQIVLEYFSLSLLAVMILIFISLRA